MSANNIPLKLIYGELHSKHYWDTRYSCLEADWRPLTVIAMALITTYIKITKFVTQFYGGNLHKVRQLRRTLQRNVLYTEFRCTKQPIYIKVI